MFVMPDRPLLVALMLKKKPQPSKSPSFTVPKRTNVADVAEVAGVSVVTVQRVFGGFTRISEGTRQKVLAAAQTVGYSPNAAARMLRTGKIPMIAYVPSSYGALSMSFYSQMVVGFQGVVSRAGLDILLAVPPPTADTKTWLQELVSSGRCGALAIHLEILSDEFLDALRSLPVPVVIMNYVPDRPAQELGVSCVGYDQAMGIQQAVRHVVAMGHRRIAFFGGQPGWQDSIRREQGFRTGMAEAGLKINETWVVPCIFTIGPESGTAAAEPIFAQRPNVPTAVICASDEIALGVMAAARHWRLRVPEDISIVGFDDEPWASFYYPPLTSIRHVGSDLGKSAATILVTRHGNSGIAPEIQILPTNLVVRESTVPVTN